MQVKLDEADVGAYADTRQLEKVCLYKKNKHKTKQKNHLLQSSAAIYSEFFKRS